MKIAILLSGHCRTFIDRIPSFKQHLLTPLLNNGFQVDIYFSTWNTIGYRKGINIIDQHLPDFNTILSEITIKKIEIEQFDRDFFYNTYYSEYYKIFPHLLGPYSCPDSVSMWYKVFKVKNLIDNYHDYSVIIKTRPDIEYSQPINIYWINDCINNKDIIYLPKFDGKYNETRQGVSDHIAIASPPKLVYYCNIFNNIPHYMKQPDCVQCGEGFLSYHLKQIDKYIIRKEFDWNYSIQNI